MLNLLLYCFWYREWNEKFLQCDHHAQLDAVFSETLFFRWKFFSTTDLEAKKNFFCFTFHFDMMKSHSLFFARTAAWCLFNRLINFTLEYICTLVGYLIEMRHCVRGWNWQKKIKMERKRRLLFWCENEWLMDADLMQIYSNGKLIWNASFFGLLLGFIDFYFYTHLFILRRNLDCL